MANFLREKHLRLERKIVIYGKTFTVVYRLILLIDKAIIPRKSFTIDMKAVEVFLLKILPYMVFYGHYNRPTVCKKECGYLECFYYFK